MSKFLDDLVEKSSGRRQSYATKTEGTSVKASSFLQNLAKGKLSLESTQEYYNKDEENYRKRLEQLQANSVNTNSSSVEVGSKYKNATPETQKYLDDTAMNMRMAGASEDDIYKKVYGYDDKTLTEIAKETRAKEKEINKKPTYEEQYGDITANADYEQNKDYRSTKHGDGTRDALTGYMFDNGYDDIEHDIINKDGIARLNYNANKGDNYLANENTYLDYLEQDEIDKYNYLYNTKGKDEARKYVDSLKTTLNQRLKQSEEEYWKEQTDKEGAEGIANRVGLWALGRVATLGKPLEYLNQLGDVFANGGDIDEFDPKNSRLSTMNNAINESIGQKWDQAAKKFIQQGYSGAYANDLRANGYSEDEIQQMMSNVDENFGNGAGNFAYQTITSMADFLTTALVTGGFNATLSDAEREIAENLSLAIMGSGAAADSTLEALSEGKDSQRAFVIGTVAGIAEILTEKVSIETLLDKTLMVQDSGKYILKNFLAEGSEEVGSDIINLVADVLVNADENKVRARTEELMAEGKTENEAFGIAVGEQLATMGMDFLGGAISGGVMGLSSVGLNNFKMGMGINDIDTARETTTELIDNPSGEKSTQMAQAILDKVNNGQKPSIMEMGRLVNQLTMDLETNEKKAEIQQKKESKLEKQPIRLEELATEKIQTENAKENAQATNTMAETENAVESENTEPHKVDEFTRDAVILDYYTSNMTEEARDVVKNMITVDNNVENYVQAATDYYIAGAKGTPINEVDSTNSGELNYNQKLAIYEEGIKAKLKGDALYNATIKGELPVLQSIKRNDGTSIEVRLSEVEESTGKQTAMPKDRATAKIKSSRYVSTAELGLLTGVEDSGVGIYDEKDYTKSMKKAKAEADKEGFDIVFVDGLMKTSDAGYVRGAIVTKSGKSTIYVQANHPSFTAEQLTKHEICHTYIDNGEIDILETISKLQNRLKGDFNKYLEKYGQAYNMYDGEHELTKDEIKAILKEIICDAYGEMNGFEQYDYGHAAIFTPFMETVKENAERNTNQANAPPKDTSGLMEWEDVDFNEDIPFNFSREAKQNFSKELRKETREFFDGKQLYTNTKLGQALNEIAFNRELNGALMNNAVDVFANPKDNVKLDKNMEQYLNEVAKLREFLVEEFKKEEFASRLPKDIAGETIKGNSSYSKSIENALVCIRSLTTQYFYDKVSELVGRPLTVEESIFAMHKLNNASGLNEQECQYCYVAMDRAYYKEMLLKYYDEYNNLYNKVSKNKKAYRESLKWKYDDTLDTKKARVDAARKNPLYKQYIGSRDSTKNMWERYQRVVTDALNGNRFLLSEDLATDQRMEDARLKSEDVAWYMNDAYHYSESAAQAVLKKRDVKVNGENLKLDYVAYNGSILKLSPKAIEDLNSEYGLRMYSYSDYVPHFILENIQMVTDASVRGLKMLSYTKDVHFARIFAETNMNINISVKGIADGKNNFVADEMQGANWTEAQKLREEFDNVGIVYVATSDAEVKWAIAQDWVDVVIPWHTVRYSGKEYMDAYGYDNYKTSQADKKWKDWKDTNDSLKAKGQAQLKKSIPPTEHNNDIDTYSRLLEENHLDPRFKKFYNEFKDKYDGNGVNMYMKLVNETRKPYKDTQPVVPKFNRSLVEAEIEKIKDFDYGVPKEYKTEANRNEFLEDSIIDAANGISDGIQNNSKEIDAKGRNLTKAVREYFSESQARDEEGRLKEYYHGSRMAGFTTFNAMRSDDKRSLFFTDSRSVAKSYYGGPETDFIPDKKYSFSELSQMIDGVSMGDEILSKTADGYALTDIFESEIASFKTLNEARDYFFDKMLPYANDLEGTYNVYLNATNPLRVDAKEERWNSIPPRYYANEYNELSIVHNGDVYEVDYADENFDYYHEILSKEEFDDKFGFQDYIYRDGGNEEYFERLYTDINGTVIPTTTRDYAAYAQASGYDSVIFDNIADTGMYTGNEYETSQAVVVFNSDQVKSVENKNPTSNSDIRYSKEPTGFQELKAENENLKKELSSLANEIDKWKGELRISKPLRVREIDADRVAKNLIKTYSSTAERTDISGMLEILGDYVLNNNADEDYSDNIQAMAHNIASELVNTASVLRDDGFGEVYDYLKKYYKGGSGITLSAKDKADIPDWNDFRKQNFGKIKLTDNGLPVDVAYGELMELFPELFPEEITHPADQLMKMVEVYDDIAPQYENPYKNYAFEMADIIDSVAKDVIEQSTNGQLKATKSTFADKQEAKLKKANDDKIKAIEKYQSKLDALKDKRNNDIAKLKESYKKANDKRVLNKKTSELRNRIMRHCKQLNNKLLHPTDKQHIPEAYKSAVATMLKSINLESNFRIINGKRVNVADIPFEESGMPTKRTEAFSNLRKQYEKLVETGSVPLDESLLGTDGWLQEIIEWGDTPIGNLDAEKLGVIINVIKAVEGSIDHANKLFNAGKWQLVSDYANALYDENMSKKQKAEWRYNSVNKLFLDMLTPEAYFYRLGETGQNLYRMMRESQDDFIRIIADAVEFNNKNLAGMDSNKLENIKVNVKLGGQEVELTTAQLMELYVLSNREQALKHITTGGIFINEVNSKKLKVERMIKPIKGITVEELAEAFKKLTPEQIVWANTMQNFLSNDMAALGNKASMEVYNYKKFTEEKYWRIRVYNLSLKQEIGADTKGVTSVASKGMTKATKPNVNNAVLLGSIFNSYTKHIFEMAEYSAWLKTMEDINRIRNFRILDEESNDEIGKVGQAIQNVHGLNGTEYLQKLLTDLSNGVHSEQAYFGGMFGNYKAAAVGMNLRVAVQQPTAILRAMDMIAPKYLSAGLINPMKGWKKAVKYSPIAQWKDWGYFDINTGKQMKDVLLENTSKMAKAKEIAMKPASMADSFAWGQLWNAIELETKDKYPDIHPNSTEFHEICAERFARIIDHSQVVDGVLQRSQIMRSESFYSKMITAFMGEPTKQYNQFMNAIYDINNSKDTTKAKKQAVRVMFSMATAGVLNAVVQSLVDAMRHSDRDKDYWSQWLEEFTGFTGDEKTFGEWFKSFLSGNVEDVANPTSYLPLVKDIMSIIKGYDVDRMDVSMISDVVTAARNFTKVITGQGKETIGYSLINMSTAIAKMFGVPADNVKKDILSIVNTIINNFGNIELQYNRDKLFYDVKAEKTNADGTKSKVNYSRYVDILHDAYTTDKSSYYNIYNDLMNNDYESDKITSTMNSKLVKDNNLESVKELNERYITPNKENKYQSTLKAITSSTAYKKLSTEKQQSARSTVYTYANESSDTLKNTLAKANKNGITDTQYLLYTLARQVVDKPNKNGKLGTYTEAEKKEAASMAGIAYEKIKAMEKSE